MTTGWSGQHRRTTGGSATPHGLSLLLPLVVLAGLAATACDDDGDRAATNVAGTYGATVIETDEGGQKVDQLATGASITLTLNADGSTTGHFFVPESEEEDTPFDTDLTGTWTRDDDTIAFSHDADTVLREIDFMVGDGELTGTFDGAVRIVLTKVE